VTGLAANFSPIPRIAPPLFGSESSGARIVLLLLSDRVLSIARSIRHSLQRRESCLSVRGPKSQKKRSFRSFISRGPIASAGWSPLLRWADCHQIRATSPQHNSVVGYESVQYCSFFVLSGRAAGRSDTARHQKVREGMSRHDTSAGRVRNGAECHWTACAGEMRSASNGLRCPSDPNKMQDAVVPWAASAPQQREEGRL
jgi:hypothetical protein